MHQVSTMSTNQEVPPLLEDVENTADKTHDATKDSTGALEGEIQGAAQESKETSDQATDGRTETLNGNIEGVADGGEAHLAKDTDDGIDGRLNLDEKACEEVGEIDLGVAVGKDSAGLDAAAVLLSGVHEGGELADLSLDGGKCGVELYLAAGRGETLASSV